MSLIVRKVLSVVDYLLSRSERLHTVTDNGKIVGYITFRYPQFLSVEELELDDTLDVSERDPEILTLIPTLKFATSEDKST